MKAIVKNIAPPKQGVKKGLPNPAAHPIVQARFPSQSNNSIVKFVQANKVPINNTMNCAKIVFFIIFER